MAASKRDMRLERNRTGGGADLGSYWRGLGQSVERSGTDCAKVRQSGFRELIKKMTKVIFPGSDEVGGCRNASPEVAEGWGEGIKPRR